MADVLLQQVLAAHGGLDRWKRFEKVQAIVTGGQLFAMKGTPQDPTPRRMTVATKGEWASVSPYGADDQRTDFTANRIAIETMNGTVVKERLHPSEHAEGKAVDAPWDGLDRAYFNGYALWTLWADLESVPRGEGWSRICERKSSNGAAQKRSFLAAMSKSSSKKQEW